MSTDSPFFTLTARPSYPKPSFAQRIVMAIAAAIVSGTLLGGVSFMFAMRSQELATVTGAVKTHSSTDGLAVRKVKLGSRG